MTFEWDLFGSTDISNVNLLSFRQWATVIPRQQSVRYNAYTEGIEILEDKERIMNLIREMKGDMDRVEDALLKIH